jgi:hypothetical protein
MDNEYSMYLRKEKCIYVFGRKTEGKRPLRKPGCRCESNVNVDLGKIGWIVWSVFIWLRIGRNKGLL